MKIHIVGASGSGKTYLSQKLAEKYGIPAYELDELFWDNSHGGYNVKRDENERNKMLHDIVIKDDWIIEGVQYAWVDESFEKADVIYCLETSPLLCRVRIIKRFFRRKIKRTSRSNETLESVIRLLKWTKKFYTVNFPEIKSKLKKYENKVVVIRNKAEMQMMVKR